MAMAEVATWAKSSPSFQAGKEDENNSMNLKQITAGMSQLEVSLRDDLQSLQNSLEEVRSKQISAAAMTRLERSNDDLQRLQNQLEEVRSKQICDVALIDQRIRAVMTQSEIQHPLRNGSVSLPDSKSKSQAIENSDKFIQGISSRLDSIEDMVAGKKAMAHASELRDSHAAFSFSETPSVSRIPTLAQSHASDDSHSASSRRVRDSLLVATSTATTADTDRVVEQLTRENTSRKVFEEQLFSRIQELERRLGDVEVPTSNPKDAQPAPMLSSANAQSSSCQKATHYPVPAMPPNLVENLGKLVEKVNKTLVASAEEAVKTLDRSGNNLQRRSLSPQPAAARHALNGIPNAAAITSASDVSSQDFPRGPFRGPVTMASAARGFGQSLDESMEVNPPLGSIRVASGGTSSPIRQMPVAATAIAVSRPTWRSPERSLDQPAACKPNAHCSARPWEAMRPIGSVPMPQR
jgi:hypothetical protein